MTHHRRVEYTDTDEAAAKATRRQFIESGRAVSLLGFDTARGVYAFDVLYYEQRRDDAMTRLETRLDYTDPRLVEAVRTTEVPGNPYAATGYGPRIPTRYMIRYAGRWRRVYVMQYANSGSAYIRVLGDDCFLDTDTEHRLSIQP